MLVVERLSGGKVIAGDGVPTHGAWCHSITYLTRCRYCGRQVFFFSCDHGCKVFFNQLGPPWPLHECVGYLSSIVGRAQLEQYMRDSGGPDPSSREAVLALDAVFGSTAQRNAERRQKTAFQTVRAKAQRDGRVSGIGVVQNVQPCTDVGGWLGVHEYGAFGLALLGGLAEGAWCRLTLVMGDLSVSNLRSYTGLARAEQMDGLESGDLVHFDAKALAYPSLRSIWVFGNVAAVMA